MFTEDLDAFLDTTYGLAVDATYNSATAVKGFHDRAYLEQLGIAGTHPVFLGKASDFPESGTPVGKTLAIGSTTWTIKGREPIDDGAWVLLTLKS